MIINTKIVRLSVVLIILIAHVNGDVGRVQIGSPGVAGRDTYVFSMNDASFLIPVYLTTTGPPITTGVSVTVTCELLPGETAAAPFTVVTFTPLVINTGSTTQGNVAASVTAPGRPIKFRCYGESPGATAQFKRASSVSPTKSIQATASPIVSICEPNVIVPNVKGVTSGTFVVKLSEPVATNNVTIFCETVTAINASYIQLSFPAVLAQEGNTEITIPYQVENTKGSLPIEVRCRAASVGGTQYKNETSLGAAAVFSLATGTVSLLPERTQISAPSFELSLVLDERLDDKSGIIEFTCTLTRVKSDADEKTAIDNRKCDTAPVNVTNNNTATENVTAEWSLGKFERVTVPKKGIATTITATLSAVPQTATTERLIVICCATNDEPKYQGKYGVSRITVNFPNLVTVNASAAALDVETVLQNPAFVNPAPCPCDLLPDECDARCCCDQKCTTEDKELFPCLSGYYGGNLSSIPSPASSCKSAGGMSQEDYSQFMCVMYENNAILGSFYMPTATGLKKVEDVNTKLTSIGTLDSLSSDTQRVSTEGVTLQSGYRQGDTILLDLFVDKTQFTPGMALPGSAFSGRCDPNAFVRFLEERSTSCPITVTPDCSNPVLSAASYAIGSSISQPACPLYPRIRDAGKSGSILSTKVDYFCVQDSNLLKGIYLPGSDPSSPDVTVSSLDSVPCTLSPDNTTYSCNVTSLGPGPSIPTITAKRCSFDNGQTFPTVPKYNSALKVCQNTVINVTYDFSWNGSRLTELKAFVLLADLPVPAGSSVELTQRFKISYTYGNLSTVNASAVPRKRSGVFGYDAQQPIIGGTHNGTSSSSVDSSSKNQPFMIKPGIDRLCSTVGAEPVLFPYATQASCVMYLKLNDFSNCKLLRAQMKAYLDLLTPFDVIATYGDPSDNTRSDWVDLIVETPSVFSTNNTTTAPTTAAPTTTPVTVTTTTPLVTNQSDQLNVTGIKFSSLVSGRCDNIPTGIYVNLLYARQGEARDVPIFQMVGAFKQYKMDQLSFECDSSPNSPCADTSRGQPFFIDLSYRFVEGPSAWKTNIWAGTSDSVEICWWDICTDDFLALWTSEVFVEIRLKVIGYTMIIAFVAIPLLYFTWPW